MLLFHCLKQRWGNPKPQNRGVQMAIFRAETKSISRGKGHNLVAALSYRAGMALTDTNEFNPNATTYDYTRKTDVVHSEILVPTLLKKKLDDADIALDFQYIANLVETGETTLRGKMKSTARLGREWVLCGVPELSRAENIQLFQQFAKEQGEEQGVISMCFVHDPKAGNDTRSKLSTPSDERNIHAHIVLLTRKVELTKANTLKLGDKSDSELSNEERTDGKICAETGKVLVKGKGLVSNRQWVKDVRKSWADILNEKLLEKGVQPVTHKSYRELGIDIVPTVHVGNNELSEGKRVQNEQINRRNESVIKSAAGSITAKSEHQITESVRRIELSDTSYDSVTELNRTQARTRDTASERVRDTTASSTTNERIRDSERVIEEQVRGIKHSNIVYNRVADFRAERAGTSDRASERIRERERLIAKSISGRSFYSVSIAKATDSHERNVRIIASRLIFRRRDRDKYDDRQMQKLDTFYKTLGIRDFAVTKGLSREEYVQPNEWVGLVRERLTDDKIINNSEIIAIVRDPVVEQSNYLAKTSQNASDSDEVRKIQNSSLESSKALESAIETYERPSNTFRI